MQTLTCAYVVGMWRTGRNAPSWRSTFTTASRCFILGFVPRSNRSGVNGLLTVKLLLTDWTSACSSWTKVTTMPPLLEKVCGSQWTLLAASKYRLYVLVACWYCNFIVVCPSATCWCYTAQHTTRRGSSHGQISTIKATQDAYGASWRVLERWPIPPSTGNERERV